jgi:hypothetical protein
VKPKMPTSAFLVTRATTSTAYSTNINGLNSQKNPKLSAAVPSTQLSSWTFFVWNATGQSVSIAKSKETIVLEKWSCTTSLE